MEESLSRNNAIFGDAFVDAVRQALENAMREQSKRAEDELNERLLSVKEAAEVLNVSADWLYRNAKKLPFSRKLGPKMLRFSHQGLQKYVAGMKISKC